jgi:GNAT superfamily N-acetyltransferase
MMARSQSRIRPARLDEADALTTLALRSKRTWGYTDDFMARAADELTLTRADLEQDVVEVLEVRGRLAGFYRLQWREAEAWLEDLFVEPEVMGTGVGRRLFSRACEVAREWGATFLALESDPHAEGFYRHLGAECVGNHESRLVPGRFLPRMRVRL